MMNRQMVHERRMATLNRQGSRLAPCADRLGDEALFAAIRTGIDLDCDFNAPEFADCAVSALVTNMTRSPA